MKFLSIPFIIYCFLQLAISNIANANSELAKAQTLTQLNNNISKLMGESTLPSLAYTLVKKESIEEIKTLGFADLDTQKKANKNTLYRIGSVSKMFTSIAILKLIEQGRLHLDDEIKTLVPEIEFFNPWHDSHPIRVVHLLEHTTGWDEIALTEYAKKNNPEQTLIESLNYYPESRTSRWPAGTRSSYSNSGSAVAAYIIEKITEKSFESYIQETIFNPLKMHNTTYLYNEQVKQFGATSYMKNKAQAYKHLIYRPVGSINSTIEDMAKFTRMLLNNGKPILTAESIKRMRNSESTNTQEIANAYGLNNIPILLNNFLYHGHDGGVNGALADLRYLPSGNAGFVILTNSSNPSKLKQIREQIVSFQTQGLNKPEVFSEANQNKISTQLSGYYYTVNPRFELAHFLNRLVAVYKVTATEQALLFGGLIFNSKPKKFLPASETSFKSIENGLVTLAVADDPIDGQVIHYGDKVLKRTSAFAVYSQLVIGILWILSIILFIITLLISGINKIRRKKLSEIHKKLRTYPLLASFTALVMITVLILGMQNPYLNFGKIGVFSLMLMLGTICYAVFTLLAVYNLFKTSPNQLSKLTYSYHAVCSIIHLCTFSYLLYFGVIGIRVWA
ncbi:serine hydrolase domain-containing protein [Thalassotalea psychrophila]|uniref:Serine hydrolase domain-containing protein n=1 Tax=Thalassotalea psychrophila TaxID=3065647 RepID=A0ABY9TZ66_9GAMM|nr:serine hydrolase domain-containing protein [Colwelliaceae bacterium SQ149]